MPELHDQIQENEVYFAPETHDTFPGVITSTSDAIVQLIYRYGDIAVPTFRLIIVVPLCPINCWTYSAFLETSHTDFSNSLSVSFDAWLDVDEEELTDIKQIVPNINKVVKKTLLTILINDA